jgi:hypothetical protein
MDDDACVRGVRAAYRKATRAREVSSPAARGWRQFHLTVMSPRAEQAIVTGAVIAGGYASLSYVGGPVGNVLSTAIASIAEWVRTPTARAAQDAIIRQYETNSIPLTPIQRGWRNILDFVGGGIWTAGAALYSLMPDVPDPSLWLVRTLLVDESNWLISPTTIVPYVRPAVGAAGVLLTWLLYRIRRPLRLVLSPVKWLGNKILGSFLKKILGIIYYAFAFARLPSRKTFNEFDEITWQMLYAPLRRVPLQTTGVHTVTLTEVGGREYEYDSSFHDVVIDAAAAASSVISKFVMKRFVPPEEGVGAVYLVDTVDVTKPTYATADGLVTMRWFERTANETSRFSSGRGAVVAPFPNYLLFRLRHGVLANPYGPQRIFIRRALAVLANTARVFDASVRWGNDEASGYYIWRSPLWHVARALPPRSAATAALLHNLQRLQQTLVPEDELFFDAAERHASLDAPLVVHIVLSRKRWTFVEPPETPSPSPSAGPFGDMTTFKQLLVTIDEGAVNTNDSIRGVVIYALHLALALNCLLVITWGGQDKVLQTRGWITSQLRANPAPTDEPRGHVQVRSPRQVGSETRCVVAYYSS